MRAHDAAAQDDHAGGLHARHAAKKHATSARMAAQARAGRLDGQAAGNLAHGREQRQPALIIGHGFVRNGRAAGREQSFRLRRIGCQVQVGK